MKTIPVDNLEVGGVLKNALYHRSGEILLRRGINLVRKHIELLLEAQIRAVFEPEPGDDIAEFVFLARNTKLPLDTLEEGVTLSKPIYEKDGGLLVEAGVKMTRSIVENFKRRGINSVFVHRDKRELKFFQVDDFLDKLYHFENKIEVIPVELDETQFAKPEDISVEAIEDVLRTPASLRVKKDGEALSERIRRVELGAKSSDNKKTAFVNLHQEAVSNTEDILAALSESKNIDGRSIGRISQKVIGALVENCDALLNLSLIKTENYLPCHSVNATILSIAIGTSIGYSKEQILELSYGAFLHDIGMTRINEDITGLKRPLTQRECMEVKKHSIYGVNILEKVRGIPTSTPFIAYQCHEREDGSGYPKGRNGHLIHDYARIVAIADTYDALISDRPYRPAKTPYEAMETIIRMAGKKMLDVGMVRSFLRYMSLFPIGSWVKLSDGHKAKVVGVNEQNYERPIVCLFKNGAPGDRVNLLKTPECRIERVIDGRLMEAGLMDGF